jgi:hypothetical protein
MDKKHLHLPVLVETEEPVPTHSIREEFCFQALTEPITIRNHRRIKTTSIYQSIIMH